jgi:hypothetical protein
MLNRPLFPQPMPPLVGCSSRAIYSTKVNLSRRITIGMATVVKGQLRRGFGSSTTRETVGVSKLAFRYLSESININVSGCSHLGSATLCHARTAALILVGTSL